MKAKFVVLALAALLCVNATVERANAEVGQAFDRMAKRISTAVDSAIGSGRWHLKYPVEYGPEVPFPLNTQLPFPWETIEGVWKAKDQDIDTLFSFKVQSDSVSGRILKVLQLDPNTGAILAQGIGVTSEDTRTVRAAMATPTSNSYWLVIRAFTRPAGPRGTSGSATLLTIRPFSATDDSDIHVVVKKIAQVPVQAPAMSLNGFPAK